ncbi:hypothetical protein HID58_043872, partial [Brassica napus]
NCPEKAREDSVRVTTRLLTEANYGSREATKAYKEVMPRLPSENRSKGFDRRTPTEVQQGARNQDNAEPTDRNFQERLDRHGRAFGVRVSTKQTRNPPPSEKATQQRDDSTTWRHKSTYEKRQEYSSPSYGFYLKSLSTKSRSLSTKKLGTVAPNTGEDCLIPNPSITINPIVGDDKEEDPRPVPHDGGATQHKPLTPSERRKEKARRLKSIVISPTNKSGETTRANQEQQPQEAEKEETLREFQNKSNRNAVSRNSKNSPNILRGAGSKKRKISLMRNSPGSGSRDSGNISGEGNKRNRSLTDDGE